MSKICPAVLRESICNQRGCSLVHTVYRCRICRAPFVSHSACKEHEASPAHLLSCVLCLAYCSSVAIYEIHVQGRRHQKFLKASNLRTPVEPIELSIPPNCRPCEICDTFVPRNIWDQHVRGRRHISRQTGKTLITALDKTENDKYDIRIDDDDVDFGVVDGTSGMVTSSKQIRVTNIGSLTVILTDAKLSSNTRSNVFQIEDAARRRQLNRTNGTSVIVRLTASRSDRGMFENRLELYFEVPSERRRFTITRSISARVGSKADYEELKGAKPYIQHKRSHGYRVTRFIGGVRPQALAEIIWARKLKSYEMPSSLDSIASRRDMEMIEKVNTIRSTFMPGEFGATTHAKHMQVKLWVEEEQASRELSEYDMQDAQLAPRRELYELQVPGLAEKRPSVIVGDRIFVNESGSSDTVSFEGFVHKVENRSVLLCFHKKFKWASGRKYDIHFDLNRLVFRRMHQAVTRPTEGARIAFPDLAQELRAVSNAAINAIQPFDDKIANNEPQHRAVASILHMPAGSVPFIVYGPPGTGKTVTIVEAIRQIVEKKLGARVLACAPSNSAADIIAGRLSALGAKALFRLIAPSRSPATVPQDVLRFTRANDRGVFICPPRNELEAFRVVVSTCCSGGVPYGIGFQPGHFTHIFIDEAAQATEPEVMIPIKTMLGPDTNIILSGDVKQLGPIVRSPVARELGLSVNFLERMMATPLYDEDKAKGKSMVKLTNNYRSHPAILNFPNAQFYKNELQACADRDVTHCISGRWGGLIKRDYPVIFHGVCGQDEREDPSPSYFNIDEASIVRDYVKNLLEDRGLHLNPEDIGVITPYRAQVLKVRRLLSTFAKETRVGSVEEYQGQEKRVIIISTVRSSPDKITFDLRHTLGFVANPRRFNVAVTRAQALLIVVGDPYVLSLDPLWKEFINYVHLGGGYTGERIDWNPAEPVDRTVRLDEARRAQSLSELEELIRRASDMDLGDDDEFEDAGAFREEE